MRQRNVVARLSAVAAALLLCTSVQASAASFSSTNTRPVADVTAGELTDLQNLLNTIYGCAGCVDAINDQSTAGKWSLPGLGTDVTAPLLRFQSGAFINDVAFGIWSGSDDGAITAYEIFSATAGTNTVAVLQWVAGSPNTVNIIGGAGVNSGTFAGINRYSFGFYITSPDGGTDGRHYSADELNDGDVAQMLAYVGGPTRWTIAFEDLNRALGADDNFVDFVVTVESLDAVPEPAVLGLLGTGLLTLAARRRRRNVQ